jgi:DNA (cytosine-5)-methyltransferase 1
VAPEGGEMNYLSVCSGIEAATVGWHSLGWQPVAFSEIEKFPCSALAHHYPDVPNWGDMTKFKEWPDANVNVLVGGTPCQSFSVAGLRKGLADPRGNLMLTYLAIAAKYSPEWLVWENVPGVLSSNGGRDFASLLRGIRQLGYGFAYRILDAQYFGVPQRRRRVFVVGCAGGWQRAAAVLFERHSLQRHIAPRREAGKGFTHSVAPSLTSSGRGVERGGDTRGQDPVIACDVAGALDTQCGGGKLTHQSVVNGHVLPVMGTLTTRTFTALGARDIEEGALVPMISHSLRGEGFDASEDGTGRGTPLVPIQNALRGKSQNGLGIGEGGEPMYTLDKASQHAVAFAHQAGGTQTTLGYDSARGTAPTLPKCQTLAVAMFKSGQGAAARSIGYSEHLAPTLPSSDEGNRTPTLLQAMQVRRLTPRECERLQGFPDDYTQVPYRNKPAADGPRYKALGNSMAVPVMAWIGKRIQQVEEITCTTKQKYHSA